MDAGFKINSPLHWGRERVVFSINSTWLTSYLYETNKQTISDPTHTTYTEKHFQVDWRSKCKRQKKHFWNSMRVYSQPQGRFSTEGGRALTTQDKNEKLNYLKIKNFWPSKKGTWKRVKRQASEQGNGTIRPSPLPPRINSQCLGTCLLSQLMG